MENQLQTSDVLFRVSNWSYYELVVFHIYKADFHWFSIEFLLKSNQFEALAGRGSMFIEF